MSTVGQPGQPRKRDKTTAQARLLNLLIHLDSDNSPTRRSQLAEVEEQYGLQHGEGLLHWAAKKMVDYEDDVLMHMTLVEFYTNLLSTKDRLPETHFRSSRSLHPPSSFPLDFLCKHGLHERTLQIYLDSDHQDPAGHYYLEGTAAKYLSTYCSTYPQDVLKQTDFVHTILTRLTRVLGSMSSGQWAQGNSPPSDLGVLSSLPRTTLLPKNAESPLFLLPPKTANTFYTLASMFHGNEDLASDQRTENSAARALYFLYTEHNPSLWTQVVAAADTVAIKEVARAAIAFIGSIITARWSHLPETIDPSDPYPLPIESQLSAQCHHSTNLPSSGIEVIMSEPAMGVVIPYLMKPAKTFSNLVGGGRGDVQGAAYKVAVKKHEVLKLLHERLIEWVGEHPDAKEMVATVGRRVAQGPMGGASDVGGRVGTLEL